MTTAISPDKSKPTFRDLELQGWNQKARDYGDYAGKITLQAAGPLLNATDVGPGMMVLDIATGPGYAAGEANALGAIATGVDFSSAMISEASRNYPDVLFYEGDAESLVFANGFFDAAVCPFGLLHMAKPDKAIAEAWRILRPGGKYAFTVWTPPERHGFFALVLDSIQRHGSMDAALPEAPPFFRFSDPAESRQALEKAGFTDIKIDEINLSWQATSGQQLIDTVYKSSVRTAMLLEAQSDAVRDKIHNDIIANISGQSCPTEMPWPAIIAVGTKPL